MGIIALIKAFFGFGASVSKEVTQRDAENNAPDQKANAEAAQIQKDRDQGAADDATTNTTKLGQDLAP
jgi:hypothetical protein